MFITGMALLVTIFFGCYIILSFTSTNREIYVAHLFLFALGSTTFIMRQFLS